MAIGAGIPRDLNISGREAVGIRFAIDFLTETTKTVLEEGEDNISQSLKGKKVVVIGGGDTGNDCIGTAVRLGAASVSQLEITPSLPTDRLDNNPWPEASRPEIFKSRGIPAPIAKIILSKFTDRSS